MPLTETCADTGMTSMPLVLTPAGADTASLLLIAFVKFSGGYKF